MTPIEKLAHLFRDFPGIGERQSKRFVYFLLTKDTAYLEELTQAITEVKDGIVECTDCHRFFAGVKGTNSVCDLCSKAGINRTQIIVVEKDADIEAIRRNRDYNGYYFVLGGAIPVLEKIPEGRVRLKALKKRVTDLLDNELEEIILAFSLTPSGNHTEDIVRDMLGVLISEKKRADQIVKIVTLGRGLSTGSELEYADNATISSALRNRH